MAVKVSTEFIQQNLYKSERNVFDCVLSLLRYTVDVLGSWRELKAFVFETSLQAVIRVSSYVQSS